MKNGSLNEKICWIFRLYDVNRDGAVCLSDIEEITSAIFYIVTEKDDILVKTQISDRVALIAKVLKIDFYNFLTVYNCRNSDFRVDKTGLAWRVGNTFVIMMMLSEEQ